jgi:hypothetical protein
MQPQSADHHHPSTGRHRGADPTESDPIRPVVRPPSTGGTKTGRLGLTPSPRHHHMNQVRPHMGNQTAKIARRAANTVNAGAVWWGGPRLRRARFAPTRSRGASAVSISGLRGRTPTPFASLRSDQGSTESLPSGNAQPGWAVAQAGNSSAPTAQTGGHDGAAAPPHLIDLASKMKTRKKGLMGWEVVFEIDG